MRFLRAYFFLFFVACQDAAYNISCTFFSVTILYFLRTRNVQRVSVFLSVDTVKLWYSYVLLCNFRQLSFFFCCSTSSVQKHFLYFIYLFLHPPPLPPFLMLMMIADTSNRDKYYIYYIKFGILEIMDWLDFIWL